MTSLINPIKEEVQKSKCRGSSNELLPLLEFVIQQFILICEQKEKHLKPQTGSIKSCRSFFHFGETSNM